MGCKLCGIKAEFHVYRAILPTLTWVCDLMWLRTAAPKTKYPS